MKTKPFAIRLEEDMRKKLEQQAEKEHRSLANMIEVMIIEYLKNAPQIKLD